MKQEYDFSNAKRNPYVKALKKQVTIRLDHETVEYFQNLASSNGIPYQTLMNLYLRDCVQQNKKLNISW
jgi:uncharacterized protein (DUF4415 family)